MLVAGVLIFASLLVSVVGCGRRGAAMAPVGGSVSYQGKPLNFGGVIFQPGAGGSCATGVIQSDGTFQLSTPGSGDGAVIGTHRVAISCFESQSPDFPPTKPGTEPVIGKLLIPRKYVSPATSGIVVEVKAENEPFRFELVD
jgi:hypothetical protein